MAARRGSPAIPKQPDDDSSDSRSRLVSLLALLTVAEVATVLRTSTKAVYTMAERGQIPGIVRVGRRLLFRQDALLEWLSESGATSPNRGVRR